MNEHYKIKMEKDNKLYKNYEHNLVFTNPSKEEATFPLDQENRTLC